MKYDFTFKIKYNPTYFINQFTSHKLLLTHTITVNLQLYSFLISSLDTVCYLKISLAYLHPENISGFLCTGGYVSSSAGPVGTVIIISIVFQCQDRQV